MAIWTIRNTIAARIQRRSIDDADAAGKYEETATKAAERALKLQERIEKLEKLTQNLVAENVQLKEYIYRLESVLISAGVKIPKRPVEAEAEKK